MPRRLIACTAILLALVLYGCATRESAESAMREHLPDVVDTLARDFIAMVREGRLDEAGSWFGEELQTPEAKQTLRMLQGVLDAGEMESIEVVNLRKNIVAAENFTRYGLEYYIRYTVPEGAGLPDYAESLRSSDEERRETDEGAERAHRIHQIISVTVDERPSGFSIVGFYVQMIPASLKEINAFSMDKMDISRQAFLTFWLLVPLFSLYAAILCLRTRMRLKFLWFLFIIVGVGKLTLNFTTGQLTTQPLSIQLLGASFFRPGLYGPWLFSVSWPLGAMLFIFRRKKLARAAREGSSGDGEWGPAGGNVPEGQQELDFDGQEDGGEKGR